jgi:hypothetical protein
MPATAEVKEFVRAKQIQFITNIAKCAPVAFALTVITVVVQAGTEGIPGALYSMAEYMAYAAGGGAIACVLAGLKG